MKRFIFTGLMVLSGPVFAANHFHCQVSETAEGGGSQMTYEKTIDHTNPGFVSLEFEVYGQAVVAQPATTATSEVFGQVCVGRVCTESGKLTIYPDSKTAAQGDRVEVDCSLRQ